jgi:hypothetical protein
MVLKRPDTGYKAAGLPADHNCYVLRAWHRTENAAPDTDSSTTVEDVATSVDEAFALLRDKVLHTALTLAKDGAATFSDADGETQLVLLEHEPFAARQLKTRTKKKHWPRFSAEKTRTRGGRYCKTRDRTELVVVR